MLQLQLSTNDKQFAKELGADEVIDYKTQTFDKLIQDYDAAFDSGGGEMYSRSFKKVSKRGHNRIHAGATKPRTDEAI